MDGGCLRQSWFLPEYADKLIELGAEYITDLHLVENYSDIESNMDSHDDEYHDEDDEEDEDDVPLDELRNINSSNVKTIETFDLTGIHIKSYGKGYLLMPPKSHKDYGKNIMVMVGGINNKKDGSSRNNFLILF